MPILKYLLIACSSLLVISCQDQGDVKQNSEPQPIPENALAGKKVLFVYGGWDGHNPEACRDLYIPWLKRMGAQVLASSSLSVYEDSAMLQSIDLIVQIWTMGEVTEPQLKGLLTAVENGTGIAGWHGGIVDAFLRAQSYHLMTGGQFLSHPGGFVPYTIEVTDHKDPIMEGIEDFSANTEQYYMLVDPNVHVLATTTFSGDHLSWIEGRTMPVMWKHRYGKGRVFVTSLGHKMEDHAIPEFEMTLKRGMIWAAR